MDRTKRILPLLCCLLWAAATRAQQPVLHARDNLHATAGTIDRIGPAESSPVTAADSTRCDGAATSLNTADTTAAAVKRPGLIRRIIDYYSRSNVDRTFEKRIDWSIAPGPSYASDTGLGLGFLVAGLYRRDRTDTVTAPSDISIYGYVTTKKYITLRFSGQNIFNGNKQKLNYSGAFVHYPGDFYGVGWTDGANGYKQALTTTIGTMNIDYGMSVWRELFLGVSGGFDYSGAKYASSGMAGRLDAIADEVAAGGAVPGGNLGRLYELWTEGRYDPALQDPFSNYIESTGEKPDALNTHIGIFAQYDTRDVSFNAFRGVFVKLEAKWYPRVLGNTGRDFGRITCTFDWYRRLWRGPCWPTTSTATSCSAPPRGTCSPSWAARTACAATTRGATATNASSRRSSNCASASTAATASWPGAVWATSGAGVPSGGATRSTTSARGIVSNSKSG